MSAHAAESRGRPIVMLAMVGLSWVAFRAVTWESPFPEQLPDALPAVPTLIAQTEPLADKPVPAAIMEEAMEVFEAKPAGKPSYVVRVPLELAPASTNLAMYSEQKYSSGGHQMLWLAAMSQLPVPLALEQQVITGTGPNAPDPLQEPDNPKRWSVDAWALWREGSGIAQGRRPSYGASQAGAVFNYRLHPSSGHDPRVFVRGYRALIDNPETEVSVGVSGRPLPDIPVRVHVEMRATERFDETEFRPSAFVTTELVPQKLPFDTYAEVYGQAGYVGGDFPTHFADGQVHIMRDVHDFDLAKVSVGAAAWGGMQKGASRVDIGPSVRVDLDIGDVPARVSVDYREQVAGEAEPGSGVAVTVSTRF